MTHDIDTLTKDFSDKDMVIILAGTNDVVNRKVQPTNLDLSRLRKIARCSKVVISSIPLRYDKPLMNVNVSKLNSWMSKEIENLPNTQLLDLSNFDITDYTKHGLHFNKHNGKPKLVEKLKNHILERHDTTTGTNNNNIGDSGMNVGSDSISYIPVLNCGYTEVIDMTSCLNGMGHVRDGVD